MNADFIKAQPERPPDLLRDSTRAQFDANLIMIRALVKHSDGEQGEYYYRQLMEQVRFLSRRHGISCQK